MIYYNNMKAKQFKVTFKVLYSLLYLVIQFFVIHEVNSHRKRRIQNQSSRVLFVFRPICLRVYLSFFYLSFILPDIGISYLVVYPLVSDSQNTVLTEKLYRQSLLAVETPDHLISSTGARGPLLTFFRPKTVISSGLRRNFKRFL